MKTLIRLPEHLWLTMRADLSRPHPFAFERIGFAYARMTKIDDETRLALLPHYSPVADDDYIQDETVGARIGSGAIRKALQEAMDREEGTFHVHMHHWSTRPRFSSVDLTNAATLLPSFHAVVPSALHGALLLGRENGIAVILSPETHQLHRAGAVSIVGYPIRIERSHYEL